jgi:hypothetical protein
MPTCPRRDRLTDEWHEAVRKFSTSVIRLHAAIGNQTFADEHRSTEQARLHVENAYTMLELHRSEHGC